MAETAVWISWLEQRQEFDCWEYVGDGVTVPRVKSKTVRVYCRYSNDTSPEMVQRANEYVKRDMQDRQGVRVGVFAR